MPSSGFWSKGRSGQPWPGSRISASLSCSTHQAINCFLVTARSDCSCLCQPLVRFVCLLPMLHEIRAWALWDKSMGLVTGICQQPQPTSASGCSIQEVCSVYPLLFTPLTFAFSAMETPLVSGFPLWMKEEGQFHSIQSWMNQAKHPVVLLYNTLACWPWPDLLFLWWYSG